MPEDLARPLVDGLGVSTAFALGSWYVGETSDQIGRHASGSLGPGGVLTLISIGFLVFMQELAGLSAPLGFSAIDNPMSPEPGEHFTEGAQQGIEVAALLRRAVSLNWRGEAAGGYNAAGVTLSAQAQALADNDAAMAQLVDDHAKCVSQTQFNLGIFQDSLLLVFLVVWVLERTEEYALVSAAYLLAHVMCPPLVAAGLGELSHCLENSVDAADQASGIDYSAVATAARKVTADCVAALSGIAARPPAPPARPAVSAPPARVREVEDPEARPADSESERVPLDVVTAGAAPEPPQAALAGLQP